MTILPLALTMGEPAGIGGDITLKAWLHRQEENLPPFFVVDDPRRLEKLARDTSINTPIVTIQAPEEAIAAFASGLPVLALKEKVEAVPGKPSPQTAQSVIASIERCVEFVHKRKALALVTNPIQKQNLYEGGFVHPGHTEFLAALAGNVDVGMMLIIPGLRVVPTTVHIPLRRALELLSADRIVYAARLTVETLKQRFGIEAPRLAIAGINPHAGEGGTIGTEEIEIIIPAIEALRAEGIDVSGPWPPDTMFTAHALHRYDAAICHYHDQALIPVKTLDVDHGVNLTMGLPFIRTSPDHGTALDIAGKGIASPSSLIAAIKLAEALGNRQNNKSY